MSVGAIIAVILGFVVAFCVGFAISKLVTRDEPIGDLRVDESDPYDGPYLFLELDKKPESFKHNKRITLKVKVENLISQK